MKKFLKVVIFIVVGIWVIGKFAPDKPEGGGQTASNTTSRVTATETRVAAAPARTCAVGQPASGNVVAVTKDYDLRKTPSASGEKIKNQKASAAIGKTMYHQIDSSTTVRHLCVDGDWSEIRIVTPEWLNFVQGWVPNNVLRGIERTASGVRLYVESDFYWDNDTSRYKPQIVAVVNKIAQQHAGCATLDTGTVAKSSSRSKPNDPVFFVTCNPSSGVPFNVWFRHTDADKTFTALKPISRGDAILACEQAAKSAATHPSTVDFSRFMDVSYMAREDGRVALDSSFSAKNSFNLELKFKIRCLFDGNTLIESNVVEAN